MIGFEGLLALNALGVKIKLARGLGRHPYQFHKDSMTLFLDPHMGLIEGAHAAEECLPQAIAAATQKDPL